jgi:tetratricopeptide (TPR) repeat protein
VWDARRSLSHGAPAFFKLADAFKTFYGVELGSTLAQDAARRLQQRPRPIQGHVLAALHVCLALAPEDSPQLRRWLGLVLELADGDPWRNQARQALEKEDWPQLEKALKEVAVEQHPPVLLHLLASYLPQDAWVTKMDVFLQMERNYPGELWASRFGNALTCNLFAWVLVTTADPEIRDEKRGLELATLSVRLAPGDSDFWNTLGVALYRAGNWKEAVSAFEKSVELGKGGDVLDRLFLAMAHWRLGHKEEARKWYDQAVDPAAPPRLLEGILPRVRAEATELLGVKQNKQ